MDQLGQRYSQRPSQIVGITNEFAALALDVAAANAGAKAEADAIRKAQNRGR